MGQYQNSQTCAAKDWIQNKPENGLRWNRRQVIISNNNDFSVSLFLDDSIWRS